MAKNLTNEEVIQRLKSLYGDSLDYSKVQYQNSRSHITLICPKHGEYQMYANNALQGRGKCPKCSIGISSKEEFIEETIKTFGDKFIFDKTDFKNLTTKVTITCPTHGDFETIPRQFLKSNCGCGKCYKEQKRQNSKKHNKKSKQDIFEENSNKWFTQCSDIHNKKYDYSKVVYTRGSDKVCIICPIHGEFWQTAADHKAGKGCLQCAIKSRADKNRLSQEEFEVRAKKVHGNKYTYGKYESAHKNMEMICPKHGIFYCSPHNHLNGCGCPICSQSVGENIITTWLNAHEIQFTRQKRYDIEGLIMYVDFYVNINNIEYIIEYNGEQHYKPIEYFGGEEEFKKQCFRDEHLRVYCNNNNIRLLEIPYLEKSNINNLLNNLIYGKIQEEAQKS